jgi:long-chain acyl-CoA synthetase
MHTLAEIYDRIVDGLWTGRIFEYARPEAALSRDSSAAFASVRARLTQANIAFGDRVILQCDHSCATITYLVGLWSIGAVVVPIKHVTTPERVAPMAADCGARFRIRPGADEIVHLGDQRPNDSTFVFCRPRRVCGTDLALIIYSSGSTGQPKGIMLSHSNVISALGSIADYLSIEASDRILCVSPLSFDYGLYQILFSFERSCEVALLGQVTDPLSLIRAIDRLEISILPVVPTLASSIVNVLPITKVALASLRKITNTGGHLQESAIRSIQARLPSVKIYAMYGLTESKRVSYLDPKDISRKLGSVGKPMPGLEAKVFKVVCEREEDPGGRVEFHEAAANELGILFVRGPSVMQGYTQSSDSGAYLVPGSYRDDNWLCTNDLFYSDEEGYLYYKGRTKDLIKQGGYCIYPKDIETLVAAHEDVVHVAVIGAVDRAGDEIARCVIQAAPADSAGATASRIRQWIDGAIDLEYRPRVISFVDAMPLNENAKIDRKSLSAMFEGVEA